MIQCEKLSKDFKIYTKKEGLKGTLKSFFKREFYINTAVKNFDLNLESHGLVGLLGPNGSGKTTLMKMLTGIITPSRGTVKVLGKCLKTEKTLSKKTSVW